MIPAANKKNTNEIKCDKIIFGFLSQYYKTRPSDLLSYYEKNNRALYMYRYTCLPANETDSH